MGVIDNSLHQFYTILQNKDKPRKRLLNKHLRGLSWVTRTLAPKNSPQSNKYPYHTAKPKLQQSANTNYMLYIIPTQCPF